MGYERLGMAFCVGLEGEARQIGDLLRKDFKVDSVCCKVCGIDKSEFNLEQIDKKRFEVMCNPVGQPNILNEKKTELNIIVGLCMGARHFIYTEFPGPSHNLGCERPGTCPQSVGCDLLPILPEQTQIRMIRDKIHLISIKG